MLFGCGDKQSPSPQSEMISKKAAPAASLEEASGSSSPVPTVVRGSVSETMNGTGYTYIQATDSSGQKIWMAIPETKVKVGDKIEFSYSKQQLMVNFHSKTLNRTFEKIYFLPGVNVLGTTQEVL